MEESEKRRERLRAMRLEATSDTVSSSSFPHQTLNSPPLANPLLDNIDSTAAAAAPPHRFDYYTDPMAAYSTNKRHHPSTPRPPPSHGPRNPEMPPSGAHQLQNNYAHHQGMYQGGDQYYSHAIPGPTSSPMGIRSPYPMHQGSSNFGAAPGRGHYVNNNLSSNPPGTGYGGSPYPAYQGSPNFGAVPGRGHCTINSPGPPGTGYGGSPNPAYPGSPNFRSPSPQGRGHWSNNSPSPGPGCGGGPSTSGGRGRGQRDGGRMYPSSGYSGGSGRGRGYNYGQARSFYKKTMVEDPWGSLTPVIWQGVKENDVKSSVNSRYFPKNRTNQNTPTTKKARVLSPFDGFNSKKSGSLAEFLAESFDEPVEDAATIL